MAFHIVRDDYKNIEAEYIIDSMQTDTDIAEYYKTQLNEAANKGYTSLAVCPVTSKGSGLSQESIFNILSGIFTEFLCDNDMDITYVVPKKDKSTLSGDYIKNVRVYVKKKFTPVNESPMMGAAKTFFNARSAAKKPMKAKGAVTEDCCFEEPVESIPSLDEALKNMYTDSFENHLQQLINKKGLKNSEVYANANISKQYFSKLLKGQVKPSKEKVLAIAIGLCLNKDETVDLLRLAGYAFSPVSQTDVIVEYFIEHKDYNVIKIDIVLFDYGSEPLSNR